VDTTQIPEPRDSPRPWPVTDDAIDRRTAPLVESSTGRRVT
jgi:hypothetical protein